MNEPERSATIIDLRWVIVLAAPFAAWAALTVLAVLIGYSLEEIRNGANRAVVALFVVGTTLLAWFVIAGTLFDDGKPIPFDLSTMSRVGDEE
jgi:hypothetical protein